MDGRLQSRLSGDGVYNVGFDGGSTAVTELPETVLTNSIGSLVIHLIDRQR
jgi:hypothetical protein